MFFDSHCRIARSFELVFFAQDVVEVIVDLLPPLPLFVEVAP